MTHTRPSGRHDVLTGAGRSAGRSAGPVALVLALAAVVAAGCADAPVAATSAPAAAAPTVAAPGGRSVTDQHAADIAYAQAMLPHVAQGLELTAMVPGRAANPALPRLVLLMDNADIEEQGQLIGRLHLWHAAVPGEAGVPLTRMTGMADAATLDRLRALSGPAFDQAWLEVMIAHHRGGGDMSRAYLSSSTDPALETIALTQVEVGGHQVAQMEAMQGAA